MSTTAPRRPTGLSGRSTVDVVVLMFTAMVVLTMLGITVLTGIVVVRGNTNGIDLGPLVLAQVQIITSIAGALVGLVAGRAMGRAERLDGG